MADKKYNEFDAGTPVGTDLLLFGDPTDGDLNKVTIDGLNSAVGMMRRVKITVDHTDFTTAALTNTIQSGFDLPIGGVVHAIVRNVKTPFAGGSISSYRIGVGKAGNTSFFSVSTTLVSGSAGLLQASGASLVFGSTTATTPVELTAVAIGDNLDQATAGEVEFWIYYSVLNL